MNALASRLLSLIGAEGPISIAQFMTMALHDPDHGYYATRDPLGLAGDFITAPEISQMFGEFLGLWIAQVWHDQGRPERAQLVELGPGRGTLMADALRALSAAAPQFLDDLDIVLVEASPALRKAQQDKLKVFAGRISWATELSEALTKRPLFLLANEFFDALPIRQWVRTERGWCERMIAATDGALGFALAPVPAPPASIPASRANAPLGGVYEYSAGATAIAAEIGRAIADEGGGALIVDYGYDIAGYGETLQAVAGHRFADVLRDPGESDLSAHVDFAALGEAARSAGAQAFGPVSQAHFLTDLGIAPRAVQLAKANPAMAESVLRALARLIEPDQMGTLFKVLAIMPDGAATPPGF